jgi:hypothetical protein
LLRKFRLHESAEQTDRKTDGTQRHKWEQF